MFVTRDSSKIRVPRDSAAFARPIRYCAGLNCAWFLKPTHVVAKAVVHCPVALPLRTASEVSPAGSVRSSTRDPWSGLTRVFRSHATASHGADALRVLASCYRYVEPAPAPKPRHDREVLMVQPDGKLAYVDDGGVVDFRDVVRRHCERREKERRDW